MLLFQCEPLCSLDGDGQVEFFALTYHLVDVDCTM